jgi:hypothetical protein
MVKEIKKNSKNIYFCTECGMAYAENKWAKKCEKWCLKHHTCNIEIVKHAIRK